MKSLVSTLFLLLLVPSVQAGDLEKREQDLHGLLLAPCCWTQPVSQHFSEAAYDVKREIRELLEKEKSDEEILAFFSDKYGERILSRPTAKGFNLAVWIFPPLILIVGGIFAFFLLKGWRQRKQEEVAPPPPDPKYLKKIDHELYGE